ncbi:hypothetical protein BDW67DRAFT_167411 [Aspergillus spinulosporus]
MQARGARQPGAWLPKILMVPCILAKGKGKKKENGCRFGLAFWCLFPPRIHAQFVFSAEFTREGAKTQVYELRNNPGKCSLG